jgi:hypothetical protein
MQNCQVPYKYRWVLRACQIFFVSFFLFVANPGYAGSYGGHHYGYGYSHHGHYSHHGNYETLGYVLLGLVGVVVLANLLSSDNYYGHKGYRNPYAYQAPKSYNTPSRIPVYPSSYNRNVGKPVYPYGDKEGWDSLARGNTRHALDIFAVQSLQDLNSGIPKVGFALAAAANGEMDRGIRAMRKAIRSDPASLNKVIINKNIEPTIESLYEDYKLALQNEEGHSDKSFMVATLSYLKQDYATANNVISENDRSQSANNLRKLIDKENGD